MAALALMVLSFGGVKYLMSPSGGTPTQEIAERQRVTPQTLAREKAEAANASASTRARVTPDYPDAAAPGASPPDAGDTPAGGASKIAADGTGEAPFATASESGGAEQASATAAADGRFPLGIEIDRSAGDLTPGVINRTRMREQHARWSTQVGATQPNVMSFPNSLVPRAEPSADVNHVRADAAPQSASMAATTGQRITADALPAGERTAPRTTALPPATVGPQSLRMAAANGDPSAEFAVGSRFADGTAGKQDFNQAAIWYQRSAARGYALAQYRLATLYERGLGVKQDGDRAKGWYLKAAEQGNVKAMHNLAVLTAGQAQPDYTTAATWFTEAAERGLADSQFNLAILRDSGLGVSADKVEAYKWLALAAKAGDKEAGKRLSALGPQLSAPQRQSADAAVARWRPKPVEPMANDPVAASEAWKRGATG